MKRRLTTGRKVVAGFGAALVVVIGIDVMSFSESLHFSRNSELVSHTYQVLDRLTAINSGVRESESDQRGYLLTGNGRFLEMSKAARSRVDVDLDVLKRLVSDDASQVQSAVALDSLIDARRRYLDATIAVRDSAGLATARERVDADEALRLTNAVMKQVEQMSGVELALLHQRNTWLDESSFSVRIVIAIGSLFAILVIVLSGLMIYAELSERMRAEAAMRDAKDAAEKANRAKSDFLARMSHELRTPLNSVIGFANVLLKKKAGSPSDPEVKYLQRIQANGEHLLGVINDILDLTKIEAGRIEVHRESVDLAPMISETISQLKPRADEKALLLVTNLPPDSLRIDTDPARLKQILTHLVSNAIKFTDVGSVTVSVVTDAMRNIPVSIEVTDTGRGISEDGREEIFAAFEQEDSTVTRQHGGTGLGLAISRALCQRLGYRLELQTELGRGSTFRVVLQPSIDRASRSHATVDPEPAAFTS